MGRVPLFPEFSDISLDLAGEIRAALEPLAPEVAEFTFANLFLFRKAHQYRVSRRDPFLCVVGQSYDGSPYAFPPLGPSAGAEEAGRTLCRLLSEGGHDPVLFPVPRAWVDERFSQGWTALSDRDQADYLYLREDLSNLSGKSLHKRRNRLMKFLREEAAGYEYRALTADLVPECLALARGWCEIRCSAERPSTFRETEAAVEALENLEPLGLTGGAIVLAGRVRAYCLGERLNAETFVVHFEKAEPGREGLAQVINRDFCQHGIPEFRFVNREQDLGDPGLRRAKESYRPTRLVEKFRVRPAVR